MCAIATAAAGQRLAGLAPADEYAPAAARAEAMVEEFVRQQRIPGFSIAVGQGGRILWSAGFGWADVEQKVPVTRETRFRTGSVAKPLTAAAAVLLHQRGALDLDRPVREYLPAFPRKAFDFTPRQLAGHLAGIRHYEDGRPLSQKRYASVAESFELFADKPLLHRPGTRYRYSSYGYVLLSAVIEAAARAPFLEHMQRYVFDPLGMTSTSPEYGREVHPRRAAFYVRKAGQLQAAPFKDFSYIWAAGGFLTTPADLVRFGDATPPNGPILAVRVANLDEKDAVLAVDRPGFFTIPHFDGYPGLLIQLDAVAIPDLRAAMRDAWLATAPRKHARSFLGVGGRDLNL